MLPKRLDLAWMSFSGIVNFCLIAMTSKHETYDAFTKSNISVSRKLSKTNEILANYWSQSKYICSIAPKEIMSKYRSLQDAGFDH